MTARLKSAAEYAATIEELIAEAEGIMAAASEDGRELTDDEQARVDEIQATVGEPASEDSPATGLWLRHDQALKRERFIAKSKSKLEAPKNEDVANRVAVSQQRSSSDRIESLGVPHRPLRAFKDTSQAYAAGQWLRASIIGDSEARQWCLDHESMLWSDSDRARRFRAAQTGGTNSAGGFTVPDPLLAALIAVREQAGISRLLSRQVSMPSDTLAIPKRSSGVTVYYPGEASAITASDVTFAQVSLTAVKRATLTEISNELLRDSVLNIADEVAADAGHALAYQEDNEFINGDGSGTYGSETGLISALGAAGTNTLGTGDTSWSAITLADLNATKGKIAEKFVRDGSMAWIMRRQLYFEVIEKLLYAAGGNTAQSIADGIRPTIFGEPVYFTERMPDDSAGNMAAFYGNFSEAVVIGERDMVEISTSEHYGFNKDVLTLRTTVRYDINVHEGGDGSNAGAYVGMKLSAT